MELNSFDNIAKVLTVQGIFFHFLQCNAFPSSSSSWSAENVENNMDVLCSMGQVVPLKVEYMSAWIVMSVAISRRGMLPMCVLRYALLPLPLVFKERHCFIKPSALSWKPKSVFQMTL